MKPFSANEKQFLTCEIKAVEDSGEFRGIASVYGVEDSYGDVIDKGAFTKTISENPMIPILWQHDSREVIGMGEVKEWQGKVLVSGRLDMEDPTAQKAYRKLKNGLMKGLSIGFYAIKTTWETVNERAIRHISELKLVEVSVVTFPALESAQVTSVKNADELAERVKALEEKLTALAAKEPAAETKAAEPVADHSRAVSMIEGIRSLIRQ
jgi:HK97 family phage prohead protease